MTFPHTATIMRTVETGGKYVYTASGTTPCFLQPLDEESTQSYGITFMKGSRCYLPIASDVVEGDRLTINGTEYGVKGVRIHQYSTLRHKRAILEEQ